MLGEGREGHIHRLRLAQGTPRDDFDGFPRQVLLHAGTLFLLACQRSAVGLEEADTAHDTHAPIALGDRDKEIRGDVFDHYKRKVPWVVLPDALWLCF